jgi:hypothetical protein
MPVSEAQSAWVRRVLGVGAGASAEGFAAAWRAAVAEWRDASDTVDGQISALQRALRAIDDDELDEIAEYGLNGVTGGFKVPLMAVLQELNPNAPDSGVMSKARKVVAGFQKHLASDERVLGVDENPFGVKVSVRATLGPALGALDSALRQAA